MKDNIDKGIYLESDTQTTDTRTLASIAVFSAIAIGLHIIPIRLPFPILPFLYYEFWEIPIVVSFLLYGPKVGLSVSIINTLSLLIIFPGSILAGPFYNLAAILSMIFPIIIIYQRIGKKIIGKSIFTLCIVSGISMRILMMTIFNSLMLPQPAPLGFNIPVDVVIGMLPALALFNGSIALYIIPISYIVSKTIGNALQTPSKYGWWMDRKVGR